jgi:transposase
MVVKMRSDESKTSGASEAALANDLRLPAFTKPQREHWPSEMSWADAMRHFERARIDYMRKFDSPEARLRSKNTERFTLPSSPQAES